MKNFAKCLCLLTAAVLLFAMCSCRESAENPSSGGSSDGTNTDYKVTVNDKISGTVRYAVRDKHSPEAEKVIADFMKQYPNIKVELVPFAEESLDNYLATQAAAGTMPDVVYGWDNLSYYAAQGWLYPLDKFIDADPEKANYNKTSVDGFVLGGKTYALPAWLQFSTVVVNLDLIDALNLDRPEYDWTIEDFVDLAKSATTDEYSGLNHVDQLDQYFMTVSMKNEAQWGYNPETRTYNLAGGEWEKAQATVNELLKYPGLVADALRNSELANKGQMDDYAKKFGMNADGLADGKILIAAQSTWDNIWLKNLTFDWDFYPVPGSKDAGYKELVHADYGIMLSTAKDPEACYEFLKYITVGKDGLISRMTYRKDYFASSDVGDVVMPEPYFIIPANGDSYVGEFFKELSFVPEGIKYMYDKLDKSVKGDYSKVLPDYNTVVNDVLYQASQKAREGQSVAALAKETETKINTGLSNSFKIFDEKMKKVQEDFDKRAG